MVLAGLGEYFEVGVVHTFLEDLAARGSGMSANLAFGGDIVAVDVAAAADIGYSLGLDAVVDRLSSAGRTLVQRDSSHRNGFGKNWCMEGLMDLM